MPPAGWSEAFLAFAALYIALGAIILRNRYPEGAVAMGAGMFCVAIWFLGAAGETAFVSNRAVFLFIRDVKYIGVAALPTAFLVFLIERLTGTRVRPRTVIGLLVIPAASVLLIWTNPLHELMWSRLRLDTVPLPRPDWGPAFRYVFAPYNYGLLAAGLVLLAVELIRASRLRRIQTAILLIGGLVPTIANVVYTVGIIPRDVQATPIALAFTAAVFSWGLFCFRLFQFNPIVLRTAFDAVAEALLLIDREGRVAAANSRTRELFGVEPAAAVGRRIDDVVTAYGLPSIIAARRPVRTEEELADGRYLLIEISDIADRRGRVRGHVIVVREMTLRRRAEEALRESEALLRGIVEHSPNGILRLRPVHAENGRIRDFLCTFANPTARRELSPDVEIQGRHITEIDPPHIAVLLDLFRRVAETGGTAATRIQVGSQGDGPRWFSVIANPILDDVAVTFVDVTEQTRRELEIEAVAYEDPLTGLLNRRGFEQDADALLRARACERSGPAALLYIDLDRFKQVNDTRGHHVGDAVLREVATRLRRCVRPEDLLARFGGDEFVALVLDTSREAARFVAERIINELAAPFVVEGDALALGASVGIVLGPAGTRSIDALLSSADTAMYRAKAAGGGIDWAHGAGTD
ncbi:MAG TPA: histidine kinase N-terminal 7TM domain-containing protein [Longimicrobiales bacterium]